MTSESPSDPYCAKRLAEEKFLADETAFFEVWFALHRRQEWKRTRPDMSDEPSDAYMTGLKPWMLEGWMARAGLHVSYARSGEGKP
jgi:hypothetical protein